MDNNISHLWKKTKKASKQVTKDFWDHKKHSKKTDRWLSLFNSFLVIIIIGMIFLMALWQFGGVIRNAAENFIESRLITNITNINFDGGNVGSNIVTKNQNLVTSSFTDLFSGTGWINKDQTTFYHDRTTTAFSFTPYFEWNDLDISDVDEDLFASANGDNLSMRCIESNCLFVSGLDLFFGSKDLENPKIEGRSITVPEDINREDLIYVTATNLDTRWLVGFVEHRNDKYFGNVFYYDGDNFTEVFEERPFESDYEGVIGFGGADDNFLVIYGAYRGQAYHVSNEGVEDISRFFEIRLMNDGFSPIVVLDERGFDNTWYVYSRTPGNAKLIKLFQNGTSDIVGVLDMTPFLGIQSYEQAYFYIDEPGVLHSQLIGSDNTKVYKEFVDKGFDKEKSQTIASSNINNYPAEVRSARIIDGDFSEIGADINFYLSNNNEDWFKVDFGEEIVFPDESGRRLLWKVDLDPDRNQYTTPFFHKIRLSYTVEFF